MQPGDSRLVCCLSQVFLSPAPYRPGRQAGLPHTRLGIAPITGGNPGLHQHGKGQHHSPNSPFFLSPFPLTSPGVPGNSWCSRTLRQLSEPCTGALLFLNSPDVPLIVFPTSGPTQHRDDCWQIGGWSLV